MSSALQSISSVFLGITVSFVALVFFAKRQIGPAVMTLAAGMGFGWITTHGKQVRALGAKVLGGDSQPATHPRAHVATHAASHAGSSHIGALLALIGGCVLGGLVLVGLLTLGAHASWVVEAPTRPAGAVGRSRLRGTRHCSSPSTTPRPTWTRCSPARRCLP